MRCAVKSNHGPHTLRWFPGGRLKLFEPDEQRFNFLVFKRSGKAGRFHNAYSARVRTEKRNRIDAVDITALWIVIRTAPLTIESQCGHLISSKVMRSPDFLRWLCIL